MLKITINNEEVVSNKDFTIEEEMLNTSSVILNNVYPKSWENDKDYVSRFYHPNDYSKCLIKDEDYTPADPGLNEEGTNFRITADTTKLNELTSMKGNTTQSGTPTPTAPVPVNVVSGRQDIEVAGKNLLKFSNELNANRSMFTYTTETQELVVCNKNASGSNFYARYETYVEQGQTYTISIEDTSSRTFYCYSNELWGTAVSGLSNKNVSKTVPFTFTSSYTGKMVIGFYGNYNNNPQILTKPMLEKGSTATEYEAYNGNTYEINLGKNLLDYQYSNLNNITRSTASEEENGFKLTSTGASGFGYGALTLDNSLLGQTITISMTSSGTKTPSGRLFYVRDNGTLGTNVGAFWTTNNSHTETLPSTLPSGSKAVALVLYISQGNNTSSDYAIFQDIQVEKGSQATTYAPYKTPIELCKIGDYQDRIYKNGNKWYLEKKIGKVVLNGSESGWTRSGASTENSFVGAFNLLTNNIINKYQTSDLWKTNRFIFGGLGRDGCFLGYNGNAETGHNLIGFTVPSTIANTIGTFKTWVSNNNIVLYYILKDTTTTEITDTELISQLESIELLEGLNNVSVVSPYLQGIINIHYNYVNETTTSDLLFCGVVKNSGNISLNPRHPHYQTLQILDFKTFLSEGETLDFVIANKTIEEAIDQVVDTISPYGFIKGNIEILGSETIIGAYSTKDKTAYDVFNYLADITQSRWTTRLIDENTVAIDFYDPTLLPRGEAIQYNETWFRNNLIDDISYSYGSNDYRNKQVMTSKEVIGELEQVQIVYANGYQTQFMTEIKIAQINEIDVNGEPKTYATEDDKELGVEADFYYSIGNNIIESADTYPTGAVITIRYLPIVEGRQIITNNDEIDRVSTATGRKGVVARYEDRNDAITSNELQLIGQSYIRYKGVPEIKLNVQTRSNLWNIGDRVQFNAPITELATEYMVKKKTINRILANPDSEEHIIYTFELTSSFNSEQAINYFDNQRAKSKGNIGEGEAISRNIDIENETNIIFYDSNIVEITVVGDNVLNSTLNSPLNN